MAKYLGTGLDSLFLFVVIHRKLKVADLY